MTIDTSQGIEAVELKQVPNEISLGKPGYYLVYSNANGEIQVISPGNNVSTPPVTGNGTKVGFLGGTPVPRQTTYTQTYATAASVVNPASLTDFTGIDNTDTSPDYAQVADLNTLRADVIALVQVVNKLIDNLQAYSLAG